LPGNQLAKRALNEVGLRPRLIASIPPSAKAFTQQSMKISKNKFTNEEVVLDFHEYEGCEFTNCRFVVLGYGAFALNQCEVTNCEFTFAGPAASVVQTMATIYHSLGDQGRNLIEGTFEQIRNAGGNKPA
jgi:hypothetical protein